ncbi:MAG: glycosyltransferase [Oscillospiraceae bacterium]|nr:glycosyltransferase [Oscillospiraceae bacterium]
MRGTDERMALVNARVSALTRRRERQGIAGLSTLSGGLLLALLTIIGRFSGTVHNLPSGDLAGSSLLADSAGGYVLVAVAAFIAAVAVTTLCFRLRDRQRTERQKDHKEKNEEENT